MDRRSFLRLSTLASAAHFADRSFTAEAQARAEGNYKALVCIFLYGGNDSNNLLVPLGLPAYHNYVDARGPLALPENSLLLLGAGANGQYGLHPSLGNTQTLFNSGYAALLANVGTLVQPMTPAQYQSGQIALPEGLFQDEAQVSEWQSGSQSATASVGWGGRIADLFSQAYNPGALLPMVLSFAGDALFCNGESTSPLVVDLHNLQEYPQVEAYLAECHLQTVFPADNELASQLRAVARTIKLRQQLGMTRQIFFVAHKGYGFHSGELYRQSERLSSLDAALGAFQNAMLEIGVADGVTAFTASEFSRTLVPNATGGSAPAWGGHHIIAGGAVKGGQIFGTFPELVLAGPNDCGFKGQWIPTTSVSQYGATLAEWFGIPAYDLPTIFPEIGNFSKPILGFLG